MRVVVVTVLAAVLGTASLASATHDPRYVPTTAKLYMRNAGTTCPGDRYLATEAGSGEVGCGYVGGAPFGELYHAGLVATTVKDYTTREVPAQVLDATRDAVGNIRVVSTSQTDRRAVGQIRVDVTVVGTTADGAQVTLGTHSSEKIVNPTNSAEVDFPFTVNTPDVHDKVSLAGVTVNVDIRGWHVLTGYHRLNGQSWLELPTYLVEQAGHDD